MTKFVIFFFFATMEPQKKMMVHYRHLFCHSKTKTEEGDGNVAFFIATKKNKFLL
jgi:hypothetical protein